MSSSCVTGNPLPGSGRFTYQCSENAKNKARNRPPTGRRMIKPVILFRRTSSCSMAIRCGARLDVISVWNICAPSAWVSPASNSVWNSLAQTRSDSSLELSYCLRSFERRIAWQQGGKWHEDEPLLSLPLPAANHNRVKNVGTSLVGKAFGLGSRISLRIVAWMRRPSAVRRDASRRL